MSRKDIYLGKTSRKGHGLFTKVSISMDMAILSFEGDIMPMECANAKRAVQLNDHFAMEFNKPDLWGQYINHSCNANCWLDFKDGIPTLRAIRNINVNEELCYNYNSVEYNLLEQFTFFHCYCDSLGCLGIIKGYFHLTDKQKQGIAGILAPYLKVKYEKNRN